MGAEPVQQLVAACRDWPQGRDRRRPACAFQECGSPVLPAVPVPTIRVTPAEYAAIAQRAFADSRHVIIAGHGPGQMDAPCVDRVMSRFNPRRAPPKTST
jgi:hypothetical protein